MKKNLTLAILIFLCGSFKALLSQPSNDACVNAISIIPDVCSYTTGTLQGATQSIPPITCNGGTSTSAYDVWYKFVATNSSHKITVSPCANLDIVVDLRSGACTGSSIGCSDNGGGVGQPEVLNYTNFVVGNTYYIRLYAYPGAIPSNPCFDIYIVSSPAVSNDNCSGAITLTPNTSCNNTPGSVGGATASGIPKLSCDYYTAGTPHLKDVWYKFVASTTGTYTVLVTPSSCTSYCGFDPVLGVYSSCGGSEIYCSDNGGGIGQPESINVNAIAGNTYFIRLYDFGLLEPNVPTFNICVTGPPSCSYSIYPTSNTSIPSAGGTGYSISVTTGSGCSWTASVGSYNWITITSGSSGNGNGTCYYSVANNPNSSSRTGYIIIAGQSFTVTQAGSGYSYSISPTSNTSVPSGGGTGYSISVTTGSGCSWTASAGSYNWITITSGSSGNGNGTCYYSVANNPNSSSRTGYITIAGQSFTVTQAGSGCNYSISPISNTSIPSGGGSGYSISVTTGSGCSWTASAGSYNWITITSGSSGNGSGTCYYSVANNPNSSSRTGYIIIAGQSFTVTQAGTAPSTITIISSTIPPWQRQDDSFQGSVTISTSNPSGASWHLEIDVFNARR